MNKGRQVCLVSYRKIVNMDAAMRRAGVCAADQVDHIITAIEDDFIVKSDGHCVSSFRWTLKQVSYIDAYGEQKWLETNGPVGYDMWKAMHILQ